MTLPNQIGSEGKAPIIVRDIKPIFFKELSVYLILNKLKQLLNHQILKKRLDSQLYIKFIIAKQVIVIIKGNIYSYWLDICIASR